MHVFGIGLHILIALYFAWHVIRTQQERYWLLVLLVVPLLGSVAYALLIWLPQMRGSRHGRRLERGVRQILDPNREVREAQQAVAESTSPANLRRLADALFCVGHADQAVAAYQRALTGVHADDPDVEVKLAEAQLESGDAAAARATLEALIARHPNYRSPRGHLIYACALAALGEQAKAREEFAIVIDNFAGLEARARYVSILSDWGAQDEAAALCHESLQRAARMPAHAKQLNAAWITQLKRLEIGLAK